MNKLLDLRNNIDEIDVELIKLFEKRMSLVQEVIEYKINNNIQIDDLDREKKMLEKHELLIKNKSYLNSYQSFLKSIINISKQFQQDYMKNK